ncbi:MAG TPA: GNAT family N-acetyltransferase [Acidimicrobiales bacterium]|nr:GNAT family N-acetyltransferase [Acidimicrobiales bacterium]
MSHPDGPGPPRLPVEFSAHRGELVVRSAVAGDFDELERLLALLALEAADPRPAGRGAFLRTLADRQRLVLVASLGDRLVGTLDLVVVDNATHGGAPWAAVENVVVDPGERRRGVARALMDGAVGLARGVGCYKVQLLSDARRPEAHALYEAMGFDAPVRGFRRYL